eukprot:992870_1
MPCQCDPHSKDNWNYIQWTGSLFSTCVYTPSDMVAFALGWCNIFLWMFAQVPQLVENYRNKCAESLSTAFLVTWILGDVSNLVGAVILNLPAVQMYTGIYFVIIDGALMFQMFYYKRKEKETQRDKGMSYKESLDRTCLLSGTSQKRAFHKKLSSHSTTIPYNVLLSTCLIGLACVTRGDIGAPSDPPCTHRTNVSPAVQVLGYVFAWISGILYFASRWPQVYLNYQRKSCQGLALGLFASAAAANIFYAVSLVMETSDFSSADFYGGTLAYLVGSALTTPGSLAIVFQFCYYGVEKPSGASDSLIKSLIKESRSENLESSLVD